MVDGIAATSLGHALHFCILPYEAPLFAHRSFCHRPATSPYGYDRLGYYHLCPHQALASLSHHFGLHGHGQPSWFARRASAGLRRGADREQGKGSAGAVVRLLRFSAQLARHQYVAPGAGRAQSPLQARRGGSGGLSHYQRREASPIISTEPKYEQGKQNLSKLTSKPKPKTWNLTP
jgi:hypothetical protein